MPKPVAANRREIWSALSAHSPSVLPILTIGELPLRYASWTGVPSDHRSRRIPAWAMIMANRRTPTAEMTKPLRAQLTVLPLGRQT